ncbi:unnamed protein product [Laminaria digitata]
MSGSARDPGRNTDCLSCRIIGTATMLGVSAYGLVVRAQTPVAQRGNRVFLLGVSGVFAAAGIARAVWPDGEAPATINADIGNVNNGGNAYKGSSEGAVAAGGITRR